MRKYLDVSEIVIRSVNISAMAHLYGEQGFPTNTLDYTRYYQVLSNVIGNYFGF